MANYAQYDPSKVSVILGVAPVRGFADGEMVTVEYSEDKRSVHIGTDGRGRHIKSKNRSGTVTVRLADYSPSNATITTLDLVDEPFPITIIDKRSNGDLFFASSCALKKIPNLAKGDSPAMNEYVFNFVSGTVTHMGAKEA